MAPCELGREAPRGCEVELVGLQVHERELVLIGEHLRDLFVRERPARDEDLTQPSRAREPLLGESGLELRLVHEPVAQEQ